DQDVIGAAVDHHQVSKPVAVQVGRADGARGQKAVAASQGETLAGLGVLDGDAVLRLVAEDEVVPAVAVAVGDRQGDVPARTPVAWPAGARGLRKPPWPVPLSRAKRLAALLTATRSSRPSASKSAATTPAVPSRERTVTVPPRSST